MLSVVLPRRVRPELFHHRCSLKRGRDSRAIHTGVQGSTSMSDEATSTTGVSNTEMSDPRVDICRTVDQFTIDKIVTTYCRLLCNNIDSEAEFLATIWPLIKIL